MLGDQIGEDKGKITSQRVLDVVEGIPKMETSFSTIGKYNDVETTEIGTYRSTPRSGGAIYGEGQGMIMTKDGHVMATWIGQGVGRFTSSGKIRFTGSLLFSASSNGKLAFLNNLAGVFEYETD